VTHAPGQRDAAGSRRGSASQIAWAAAIGVFAACTVVNADIVDINGGTSWGGWSHIGNAQTSGTWVQGSTSRTYEMYSTMFTLDAGQSVVGSRLGDSAVGNGTGYTGDSQASLFSGSWKAGDRIVGVGLQYSGPTRLGTIWVHVDWAGDSIQAASSVGASDGVYTANAGDLAIYSLGGPNGAARFRATQYSVFTGYTADGGSNYIAPYGVGATTASPARSFAVLASGSGSAATSAQYFVNLDAIARSNGGATFGEGMLGPATRLGFLEADPNWSGYTQQVFSIPTPGVTALFGVSLLLPLQGRRRRRTDA
jgi:hypothetical protein